MSKYSITPINKFSQWSKIIKDLRSQGVDIYVVGDTETTGGVSSGSISIFEKTEQEFKGKRHRIVEVGFIFCQKTKEGIFEPIKDNDGENIFFHEYINPFSEDKEKTTRLNSINEMPNGAFYVHGISKNFLFGDDSMEGYRLKVPAPTMQDIVMDFIDLTTAKEDLDGDIYGVFHNVPFDFTFLDAEFEECEDEFGNKITRFQDLVFPYDTVMFFKSVITNDDIAELKERAGVKKGKYSLDTLREIFDNLGYVDNSKIDRTLHGAYKDVILLIELYNGVQRYLAEKNSYKKQKSYQKRKDFSQYKIRNIESSEKQEGSINKRNKIV